MTITDDIVKGLRNSTPLYAVAGTADLAAEKLRGVPVLIDKLRATDPKTVQARVSTQAKDAQSRLSAQAKDAQTKLSAQAKDAQSRLNETFAGLDQNLKGLRERPRPDLRKLGESVQGIALQGVGRAAEYAVKARETYDELAERGKGAVAQWRGEAADEVVEIAAKVEPAPGPAAAPAQDQKDQVKPAAAKKPAPRRASTTKKTAQ